MGTSIHVVFRISTKKSAEVLGSIYLLRIENRKKSYKSLGLPPLPQRLWDETNLRVRKSKEIDYERYNQSITETLRNAAASGNSLTLLKEQTDKRSFLRYFEGLVTGSTFIHNHGTRMKYLSVLNKLQTYLTSKHTYDLAFKDLSVAFLDDFFAFMIQSGMSKNSAIHYLKVVHGFVKRSMVDREVMNTYDPFVHFKFPKKEIKLKETLEREEINHLIQAPLSNPRWLETRRMFLFQFFSGGMRVSDLLCLRYRNLVHGKLSYTMFKTSHPMAFRLSEQQLNLLSELPSVSIHRRNNHPRTPTLMDDLLEERVTQHNLQVDIQWLSSDPITNALRIKHTFIKDPPRFVFLEEGDFNEMGFPFINPLREMICNMSVTEISREIKSIASYLQSKGRKNISLRTTFKDGFYDSKRELIEKYQVLLEEELIEIDKNFFREVTEKLHQLGTSTETRNEFVFGRLKELDFAEVLDQENFSTVTEEHYKKINKASIVYNRNLKALQKSIGLKKTLKSHLPRTTFANLMMRGKVNHRDISNTLGHSSISITDEYLRTGFQNDGVDSVIQGTSDDFSPSRRES
jgi:site-specific recombinase XerD